MNQLSKIIKKEIFPISLILLLAFSRLLPHPPNFTPIIAVAIMSGYFFNNIKLSFIVLLIPMLLVDTLIGFYEHMFFVYLSLFLITFIFFNISKKINFRNLLFFGFFGSLIFYLISNFGVWISDIPSPVTHLPYEKNLNGLINCYFLAIPFFKNTVLSTLIFSYTAFLANHFYEKMGQQKIFGKSIK
tara:strand:+ start:3662 stop:4222 length:561 start_codon:yes stop_codon:yes gene_type:complete